MKQGWRKEDSQEEEEEHEEEESLKRGEKKTQPADLRRRAINEESLEQSTVSCKMNDILMLV